MYRHALLLSIFCNEAYIQTILMVHLYVDSSVLVDLLTNNIARF